MKKNTDPQFAKCGVDLKKETNLARLINLEKVEEIVNTQNERIKPYVNEAGERGCMARYMTMVNLPLTLWRCSEENRDTSPDEIAGIITTGFATCLASHIKTHVPEEFLGAAITGAAMELQLKIMQILQVSEKSSDLVTSIEREEIGVA